MSKVYYWESAVSENIAQFSSCQKQILALLNGDYAQADLDSKKLPGYRLYTARINDADRLLFTTLKINGRSHLLLLEVILNHDYQKSKYLNNPRSLKKFLEADQGSLKLDSITEASFQESKASPLEAEANTPSTILDYHPVHYYQERFILLNDEQNKVQKANLPLIVSGPPGSGKSCVALSLLQEQAEKQTSESLPLLYLAKSTALVKQMRKLWQEFTELSNKNVVFKSYDELFEDREEKRASFTHFEAWYQGLSKKHKDKLGSFSSSLLYHEFQVASSAENINDYLQIGRKNSLLSNSDESAKRQLYQVYLHYLKTLRESLLINLDFYEPEQLKHFEVIVVDEAQDLTPLQLKTLYRMALQNKVVFCMDTHQSLQVSKSTLPYLEKLTLKNHIRLPLAYRSGKNIVEMANRLLQLKNTVVGGAAVKNEWSEMVLPESKDLNQGAVLWESAQTEIQDKLKEHKETDCAVITWPQYLKQAEKRFNTPLLFTPEQIKGLEYKVVIVYRPLDQEIFTEANQHLRQGDLKTVKGRAKAKVTVREEFTPAFNQLFTALTRAIDKLFILQDQTHHIDTLFSHLKQSPLKTEAAVQAPLAPLVQETTAAEWQKQAERLLQNGNEAQAKAIFVSKLHKTEQEFQSFKAELMGEIAQAKPAQVSNEPEFKTTAASAAPKEQPVVVTSKINQSPAKTQNDDFSNPKWVKFMEVLFRNPTDNNLSQLFSMKAERVNAILFDLLAPDHRSLFEYLLDEHCERITLTFKNHLPLVAKLNTEKLATVIHTVSGRKLSLNMDSDGHREPMASNSLNSFDSDRLLATVNFLVECSPDLAKRLDLSHWIALSGEASGVLRLHPAIVSKVGISLLTTIIKIVPQWAEFFTVDLLSAKIKHRRPSEIGHETLLGHILEINEIQFLELLLEHNPALVNDLRPQNIRQHFSTEKLDLSEILAEEKTGARWIEAAIENKVKEDSLLKYINDLFQSDNAALLNQKLCDTQADLQIHRQILSRLIKFPGLLFKVLSANRDKLHLLDSKTLEAPNPYVDVTCPYLSSITSGIDSLIILLKHAPAFSKFYNKGHWLASSPYPHHGRLCPFSIIQFHEDKGLELSRALLTSEQLNVKDLSADELFKKYNFNNPAFTGSVYDTLNRDGCTLQVLYEILNARHDLVRALSGQFLSEEVNDGMVQPRFCVLLKDFHGMQVLNLIIELNPSAIANLSIKENSPAFTNLVANLLRSHTGPSLLQKLSSLNPKIAEACANARRQRTYNSHLLSQSPARFYTPEQKPESEDKTSVNAKTDQGKVKNSIV